MQDPDIQKAIGGIARTEYPDDAMPLRVNIRAIRQAKGLTIQQLADMVGTSAPHVSNIERGLKNLNNHLMVRFADALGVTPADLIADDEDESFRALEEMVRGLSPEDRDRVLAFAAALARSKG
jgi:transcriptional regulator with XRE-family HTH domain